MTQQASCTIACIVSMASTMPLTLEPFMNSTVPSPDLQRLDGSGESRDECSCSLRRSTAEGQPQHCCSSRLLWCWTSWRAFGGTSLGRSSLACLLPCLFWCRPMQTCWRCSCCCIPRLHLQTLQHTACLPLNWLFSLLCLSLALCPLYLTFALCPLPLTFVLCPLCLTFAVCPLCSKCCSIGATSVSDGLCVGDWDAT